MKKSLMFLGLGIGLSAAAAVAHPTDVPYETRGECQAAHAESSQGDRERLVALGIFPTIGAAQRTFQDDFVCEYDEDEGAWYIVSYLGV